MEDLSMEAYGASHKAPKDANYKSRAYVDPGASQTKMRFKLPEGLHGDASNDYLVLLQWHWVTGNSCRSPGYDDVDYPPGWEPANTGPCPAQLSNTGIDVPPEQFWNCAEVKILPNNNTPVVPTTPAPVTKAPTATPTVSNAPTAPNVNQTPAPVTSAPTAGSGNGEGCCSQNYKDCDATWCGDSETQCLSCGSAGDKTWLPNGPVTECIARWGTCTTAVDDCCAPAVCVGNEYYRQCLPDPNGGGTTPAPVSPAPVTSTSAPVVVTPAPVVSAPTPTTAAPVVVVPPTTPAPVVTVGGNGLFKTDQTRSSYEALLELVPLTNVVQSGSNPIWALVSEGGAAGLGNDVVSEGQGYAVMIAGITLAAMDSNDPNRADAIYRFSAYFNGWKKMCENSTPVSPCQSVKYCNGGTVACLPGWKHDKDFTTVVGTGAAPDGDQDAIAGMIFAVKALELDNASDRPSWYDEVRQWADASATSFMVYNTKISTSQKNRIVKLGSCWGGWEMDGNNPSYHGPGMYRMMKEYQANFPAADRDYTMPNFNDNVNNLEERWQMVIDTSYKFIAATQCADVGIVPNWAMATELGDGSVAHYPGAFSGSGTPQYQFGSEASRTMWRTLFDVAVYPNDAFEQVEAVLNSVHARLADPAHFIAAQENWVDATLEPCDGVTSVFPSWRYNAFIYAPVYSTLVLEASNVATADQQKMVDAAGVIVNTIPMSTSYYSRCWSVIGILTLNGDLAKASQRVLHGNGGGVPTIPSPTTPSPVAVVTPAPVVVKCSSFSDKATCNAQEELKCSFRFLNGEQVCRKALDTTACSKFDGKRNRCRRKGCKWNGGSKKCVGRWN